MFYHNFSNPIEMLMIHFFWWSFPDYDHPHLLKQVLAKARSLLILIQPIAIMLLSWFALMDWPPLLPMCQICQKKLLLWTKKKDMPLLKKPKKNYDILRKCKKAWATQFPCIEMLKNNSKKVNQVKCMMCSFVKGKVVLLGPKVATFENMLKKQRLFETCLARARRKENGMTPRNVIMKRIKWFIFNIVAYQLLNKFKKGFRGNEEKKQQFVAILHLL